MRNNDNDYLGEYMAECPKCHHRYNKNLNGNKCPDCGYRNSKILKVFPFVILIMALAIYFLYPFRYIILNKISNLGISSTLKEKINLLNPVYVLIGINVILYICGWNSNNVEQYGNSYDSTIKRGQITRLLSSGFAHADLLHILCNMWSLYNLGIFAYSLLGIWLFLLLYFCSLIIGGILSALIHHWNDDDEIFSIGASGAICGLLGFYVIFIYKLGFDPVMLGQALYQAFAPMMITIFNPRIDHIGHLCGLIVGIVFGILLLF